MFHAKQINAVVDRQVVVDAVLLKATMNNKIHLTAYVTVLTVYQWEMHVCKSKTTAIDDVEYGVNSSHKCMRVDSVLFSIYLFLFVHFHKRNDLMYR